MINSATGWILYIQVTISLPTPTHAQQTICCWLSFLLLWNAFVVEEKSGCQRPAFCWAPATGYLKWSFWLLSHARLLNDNCLPSQYVLNHWKGIPISFYPGRLKFTFEKVTYSNAWGIDHWINWKYDKPNQGDGYVLNNACGFGQMGDCNDTNGNVHPGAA